ncbi:hypothetical protein K438DRAFT_1757786 [Mycena galopus ATCC 62051]|nr:hypothetical protein K438DRAFT_1757786 [Mycena galopus ATCC 62051]
MSDPSSQKPSEYVFFPQRFELPGWDTLGGMEQVWAHLQPQLEAWGYMLRPRYRPGWSLPPGTGPWGSESAIPLYGTALVRTLCARASLSPPASTTTFASVAAAAPLTTPVDSRSTTPPPRTAHHGIRTESPSPGFAFRSASYRQSPFQEMFAPLCTPLSAERPPEFDIVRVLERSVSDGNTASRIQGKFQKLWWLWGEVDLGCSPAKAFWGVMDGVGSEIWTELTSQGYDKEVLMYHPMVKTGRS